MKHASLRSLKMILDCLLQFFIHKEMGNTVSNVSRWMIPSITSLSKLKQLNSTHSQAFSLWCMWTSLDEMGLTCFFFICYSCCILEDKCIVDPDFFSKGPSSSSAPALSEESVSLGNTTPFHNSGLYKNIQMWWVSRPSLGYSLCAYQSIWHCGYSLRRRRHHSIQGF